MTARGSGLRTLDGAEEIRFGRAFGESSAGKAETREAKQDEQESDHGGEDACSTVELADSLEKMLPVLLQGLESDDRTKAPPLLARDRGAWDGEAAAQRRGAGTHHVLAQTMVVGVPRPGCRWKAGDHAGRFTQGSPAAKT
jgi:hypothetical protein